MTDPQLNLDDLVRSVAARLRVSRVPQVFAVWADGSVTAECAGFTHRVLQNGQLRAPLARFESGKPTSKAFIRTLILAGLRDRGLSTSGE